MISGRGHSRRGAVRGWWAFAARMLALVLALSLVSPLASLADDLAYYAGGQTHVTELASVDIAPHADASDPGLASHLHCGCHQAAPLKTALVEPLFDGVRPRYARLTVAVSSVSPDPMPRPPRT